MVDVEETALAVVELGVGGGNDQAGHNGSDERPHPDCLEKYQYILTDKIIFAFNSFVFSYFQVNLSLVLLTQMLILSKFSQTKFRTNYSILTLKTQNYSPSKNK